MAADRTLANLRRKRIRIHAALRKLEPLVAAYREKLAAIEAEIHQRDPQLTLPAQHRTYRPNRHFERGELPRLAMDILRQEGAPLPTAVVAVRALARKGVEQPGPGLRKLTRNRLNNIFIAWEKRGLVVKVGRGNATRRGLVAGRPFTVC